MSRTGPAFVENESEMRKDINRKQQNGEITKATADAFIDLYEFAMDLGDDVTIGGAKNANFQLKVAAHQGSYRGNPSVFTANVNRELQVWPARMAIDNDSLDSVAWEEQDYHDYEAAFERLSGGSNTADFEMVGSTFDLDEFKAVVEEFVSTCRQRSPESD